MSVLSTANNADALYAASGSRVISTAISAEALSLASGNPVYVTSISVDVLFPVNELYSNCSGLFYLSSDAILAKSIESSLQQQFSTLADAKLFSNINIECLVSSSVNVSSYLSSKDRIEGIDISINSPDLSGIECVSVKSLSSTCASKSQVIALNSANTLSMAGSAISKITLSDIGKILSLSSSCSCSSKADAKLSLRSIASSISSLSGGNANLSINGGLRSVNNCNSSSIQILDKYAGLFNNFYCMQKLYPVSDIFVSGIIGANGENSSLYSLIDDGSILGNPYSLFGSGSTAFDKTTFIQPSSIQTSGRFSYKCEMTTPIVTPEFSSLRISASAPIKNLLSKSPPRFSLTNIKLEDPSGNLIIRYNDIVIKGDADHYSDYSNYFTTYFSTPAINNAAINQWHPDYPIFKNTSGYSLSLDILSENLDDPFDTGFNDGFQEFNQFFYESSASNDDYLSTDGSPTSTQSQRLINPSHSIKITAIEICNSGRLGPGVENYVPIFTQVENKGRRIEKKIYPKSVDLLSNNNGIFPQETSLWSSGASGYTLTSSSILDSGKLTLKFSYYGQPSNLEITNGAFNSAFDESVQNSWINPSGAFNTQNQNQEYSSLDYFDIESVYLAVLAKKAIGSRDFSLDVVGYSDDGLLNVTSAVGGFLQNVSGVGSIPSSSGFLPTDELSIGGESLSDKDQFYKTSLTNNDGGDHYLLSNWPVINSTEFKWYEVPLKIYDDRVPIGQSRDYSLSSLFERLNLDIYPIPSGATISDIYLAVRYKPQNAIALLTQGSELIQQVKNRNEIKLFPSSRKSSDPLINSSQYGPLSKIERIPQAFIDFSGVKTNYSRKWRGLPGLVNGPFDPNQFDFSFENPLLDSPFVYGYYDFNLGEGHTIVPNVGSNTGNIHLSHGGGYRYKNIGWRFSTSNLFSAELPGYSGLYNTSDWTSLSSGSSNFLNHPLYGKISDAFSNIVKTRGNECYIDFGKHMEVSGGFSAYIRFTPNANHSGVNFNLLNSGVLISKWGKHNNQAGHPIQFVLCYESGYLCAIGSDSSNNLYKIKDTVPYSGYQYPLSVILTYNDNDSRTLKLYTDNELAANWNMLRASSVPFDLRSSNSDLIVGYSPGSGVGMNMLVSEFGISDKGNVVFSDPSLRDKEVTADDVFKEIRLKWTSSSGVDSTLYDYINEDILDWSIGDFKYCNFSPAFSQLTKRSGRDLIAFNIVSNGLPYSSITNISLPSGMRDDVSYHSQIENDSLRVYLSDADDKFYAVRPRISKNLPVGYKFSERAIAVDSVLEHISSGDIIWSNGSIGPKLIVSLYTKAQEPYWHIDGQNWGLVNRYYHYLEPSSCLVKLSSLFDYNSLLDESESWALFPNETRLSEFSERFYSEDIDDMYLQYDIVYPSGSPYSSRINLHTVNVRLEDSFLSSSPVSGSLNLSSSGNPSPVSNYLNLYSENNIAVSGNTFNLYTIGPIRVENSGLPLYTSGAIISTASLPLLITGLSGQLDSINLHTSGSPEKSIYSFDGSINLSILGKGIVTSSGGDKIGLSLTSFNDDVSILSPDILPLATIGSSGSTSVNINIPIFLMNEIDSDILQKSGVMNLSTIASSALVGRYSSNSMNLFTFSNRPTGNLNLVLFGDNYPSVSSVNQMNLFAANYEIFGSPLLNWFNQNYGYPIDIDDNVYAEIPVSDNIRGVDLIGYGSCDGDSPRKAKDKPIITHDTVWRAEFCEDGGIFRAIETYTNLPTYSGNYYGIRKFTGLKPGSPYTATLTIKTGSTDPIELPREWQEWEYGSNSAINYSGIKLVGDYDYPFESGRNANDRFGFSIATKKDLMAVSAPFKEIPDESGSLISNAGSVYLYRRSSDVPGQKASWNYESEIILPSGFRRDYISNTIDGLLCYPNRQNPEFCISGQKWNIGQEGREFGYSLDIASSGEREVLVVGAPGASWNRTFETISSSGISVCMLVFTDKFNYDKDKISEINDVARKWDVLYKYFSAPWKEGFQPYIDIKVLVCQLAFSDSEKPTVSPTENWFYHTYLERLDDTDLIRQVGYSEVYGNMLSGIKRIFNYAFPLSNSAHSGIPPIVGLFEDNSPSTTYKNAFKPVVEEFVNYYKQFAYASGVTDQVSSASGYVNRIDDASEVWNNASILLMDRTLDSGNLVQNSALSYITSGVGQEWARPGSYEFQIPPASGGRVFIFEKENGEFNLVQEIKSPEESAGYFGGYSIQYNDRFGHSVSISDNSEIIAIGSPYSQTACSFFERKDAENQRMYSQLKQWLIYRGMNSELDYFNEIEAVSGFSIAAISTYNLLSKSDKFSLRKDENFWQNNGGPINLYQNIYSYRYSDITPTGTWGFIPNEFAPTSRLGYSIDVNEEGSIVAVGAPTDSFNDIDDYNLWYKNEDSWASYVNAGAVRVFESRRYYPHNLAVEFYRFGNLDRNSHPELKEYYDQMGLYFNPDNIPFVRTQFEENSIPENAGLAFIITPEIDAASDEVISNIKEWLSLGDRTLVLVGNDPVWEDNGRYKKSNDIINKILFKLGSSMRLFPARNRYESLPDCISEPDVQSDRFNVTASFVPSYAHPTTISNNNLFAKGVADIRIDLSKFGLSGYYKQYSCDESNPYCELPMSDLGDLRFEFSHTCEDSNGVSVSYKENWPYHFGNDNPGQDRCTEPLEALINRKNQDPRPILTAAEWTEDTQYTVPAKSGSITFCSGIYTTIAKNSTYFTFSENQLNENSFFLVEGSGSIPSGVFKNFNINNFNDPESFDGRDALMQATGIPYDLSRVSSVNVVMEDSPLVTIDSYESSEVILIAALASESSINLGYASNKSNQNNDQNILFYNNLVAKDCNNPSNIYQLSGWTKRNSFKSAYYDSQLRRLFESHGHYVVEGFDATLADIPYTADVLWIPAPDDKPNDLDLAKIKSWLSIGNKKLVITYNGNNRIADNVNYICNKLNIPSKPCYSQCEGKYLNIEGPLGLHATNPLKHAISGCDNGYTWINGSNSSTRVDLLSFIGDYNYEKVNVSDINTFIPIVCPSSSMAVYAPNRTVELCWTTPYAWKMESYSDVLFSGIPGSGYRLFIDYISESPEENQEIEIIVHNVSPAPFQPPLNIRRRIGQTSSFLKETRAIDFILPSGSNEILVSFDTRHNFKIQNTTTVPKTPRILSISGCLLPIEERIATQDLNVLIGEECRNEAWFEPEVTITVPGEFRPIKTDSSKYCQNECDGQLIEDGPVIAAEEYETFSSFSNGESRSRIVLISDSTIIQGQCPHYRNDALSENQLFIRSLYPRTQRVATDNIIQGRKFEFTQKIVSPERGSPGKYFAYSGNSGVFSKFGTISVPTSSSGDFSDKEKTYNPLTLIRPEDPIGEEEIKKAKQNFVNNSLNKYGFFPRFSGVVGSEVLVDARVTGGIPDILRKTGRDYLDIDMISSGGYPGDLFGYSVSVDGDKIVVGSPFNAFNGTAPLSWDDAISGSGTMSINSNGGGGAAFIFQRTNLGSGSLSTSLPWQFVKKLKPSSVGILNSGNDMFGLDISMDSDFIAVGSPGHSYDTVHEHIYSGDSAFIRKEFDLSFTIPEHIFYESSGFVANNGAVYTFINKINDWNLRSKEWVLAEKINAHDYTQRASGERNMFGNSVSINRSKRNDSDYTMAVGSMNDRFAISGSHPSQPLTRAGSAFTYDAMLRRQQDSIVSSGGWIKATVFGDKSDSAKLISFVQQNTSGDPITYKVSGVIFANQEGEIFIEASGFDSTEKGFVTQRPVIESVLGSLLPGVQVNTGLNIVTSGKPDDKSNSVNMVLIGPDSDYVYNNLNMFTSSWPGLNNSGSPLNMTTYGASGIILSDSVPLTTSGTSSMGQVLSLRIRGK